MSKNKTVEVHRHFSLVEMQQEDPEVKAWLGQSYRAIGPYFQGNVTASGLTFEEQKWLLPIHLGIEAEDKDFRRTVTKYYDEFITSVPKEGIKLNISLADDTKPLAKDNLPNNIKDYLTWRHVRGHNDVAKDKADAEKTFGKRYYIHDPEGFSVEASAINDLEDKAMQLYMRYKEDPIKTDQILTVLGTNIKGVKSAQKILILKEYATKRNGLNEVEQREFLDRFIKAVEDRDLEYKYLVQEMIGAQYLRRVGNNIVYAESGKQIGVNMEDAVLYFKNPKNSRELNLMRAEYQAKLKKGSEYLPKEDPEPVEVKETKEKAK